ncbi:hypothetical protein EMIHUDRAFT_213184 [Emiliania huxleyi CCMP1516]|uniref:Uncharacterized protein n=2 Tax=Emiliania huxleyi TaxID=2903 RepID=A0A0D3INU6_EMIH1|nr:hypothetical protein EMIHUDRAFT_213184 [Emiliania huxleyi CCMP1516]EOD12931.1 hypothetical protein EMIHUDRAFT_213184 [Emiliania huxleyi CCMP1516]|eukprot:XP_005765360.1 hypothetical protein EMIHUDRAFT_213184 [Emiliania huxleyi CCMP1516]
MGRHRSTLRDLGWSAGNSPNPWKHGSAKRVVRALDYGSIEVDAYAHSAPDDARGGRLLDRIFEQESDGAGRQPPPLEREGQRGSVSQQQLLDSQLRDGMRGEQGHLRLQAAVQRTKLADPATRPAAAEARLGAAAPAALQPRLEQRCPDGAAPLGERERALVQAQERVAARETAAAQLLANAARERADLRAAREVGAEGRASAVVGAISCNLMCNLVSSQVGAEGRAAVEGRVAVVGRSSSCDVTLPKDDQALSLREEALAVRAASVAEAEAAIEKARLGFGYGLIGEALVQLRPGDVVQIGSSSFRLQID